jgi:tetratricopeptide (TPR) repeat protein
MADSPKTKTVKVSGTPRLLSERLAEAGRLVASRRWSQAREILDALDERYPGRLDVLSLLLDVCFEQKDMSRYLSVCERLLAQNPDDPDMTLSLAGAYLSNAYLVLALQTFQDFLARWPSHQRASEAQKTVKDLEEELRDASREFARPWDEFFQMSLLHDRVQVFMHRGQYTEALHLGQEVIEKYPWFVPAFNNVSAMFWEQGQPEPAISTALKVLDAEPQNVHALSNLVRYHVLSGHSDEAPQFAARLKASTAPAFDRTLKIAEALTYLGDDQGVLDAFQSADRETELNVPSAGMLYHLAAVAAFRLGKTADAERYWRRSLKLLPGFELAAGNLDDLRKPPAERHGPWPFTLGYYIKKETINELIEALSAGYSETQSVRRSAGSKVKSPGKNISVEGDLDVNIVNVTHRWYESHPEVAALLPVLLERGDPGGREFAFKMVNFLETPALLEALKDFSLGRFGPDMMRAEAAQKCIEAGLLPSGMQKLWSRGQPRDVILMGFEIHAEPVETHGRQVEKLHEAALEAMHAGDGAKGEALLRQAIELEPDAPDLLNNLGAALELQGRKDESYALLRDVYARFPDYFFGQTSMAMLHIHQGEMDQARRILEGLGARPRLHILEFDALCVTYIDLFLAENNKPAARSWLEMWEKVDPDHPKLSLYRMKLGTVSRTPRWKKGRRR